MWNDPLDGLIAVWFSCGAASAVAAKLTLDKYGAARVRVVNCPVVEEHPDNLRFLADVQSWLGVPIETATNPKYPAASAREVWERRAYMSGIAGAPCTLELKKEARRQWERVHSPAWHVLGFTADERARHDRFVATERNNVLPVLIDAGLRKSDCFEILRQAGLRLPAIYGMGYPNANCVGCVKATSPAYWSLVRRTFPAVFADRAEQSRRLGARLARLHGERVFLDELPDEIDGQPELNFDCNVFCEEPANVE